MLETRSRRPQRAAPFQVCRTRAGLANARKNGKRLGPPVKWQPEMVKQARRLMERGDLTAQEIAIVSASHRAGTLIPFRALAEPSAYHGTRDAILCFAGMVHLLPISVLGALVLAGHWLFKVGDSIIGDIERAHEPNRRRRKQI